MANGIDRLLYGGETQLDTGRLDRIKRENADHSGKNPDSEFSETFRREVARKHIDPSVQFKISSELFNSNMSRKEVINHVGADPSRKKLYEATKEFESFFVEKMFREMKKNVNKGELFHGGFAEDVFDDLLLTERVRSVSKQSEFGLAEKMYQQLSRIL